MAAESRPTPQLGNSRQIISHPISCVGEKRDTYLMMTRFPLTSTLSRVSLLDRDMLVGWFFPVLSLTPGLLRFLRLVSYRMTAVTLKERSDSNEGGTKHTPCIWLATAEEKFLSFNWTVRQSFTATSACPSAVFFQWNFISDLYWHIYNICTLYNLNM